MSWHFDARDTPQQRSILRTCRSAQRVRERFPTGTRIESVHKSMRRTERLGVFGTVARHVPGTNSQGGYLVIDWDNGHQGRTGAINVDVAE
jgi:hypothetical protein